LAGAHHLGVEISALSYFRVGVVTTVPALLAAAAGLWVAAQLTGGG
jgi:Na+/H+ antiporter NhaD/arsenite permease-like protein